MKLSQRIQSIAESATLAVSAQAAKMKREGIDVIGFGAGEPDFPTPPHIVAAAQKALADGHTKYPKPASGLPELKEAICEKLRRDNDLEYAPNQVIVTVGGKDACYAICQTLIDPGDEVIIPVPYWVSYPDMVRLAGGVPVFVRPETDEMYLTATQIRDAVTDRTRMVILNYPSNPGGHVYSPQQIRDIAAALSDTSATVMSDEIYDGMVYGGRSFLSFAAVSDDAYNRTITVNSASKTYSMTGWRLGFAAGPPDVISALAKLQSQNTSGAATFAQIAYAAALSGDQSCVHEMREELQTRGRRMHERLNDIPGIRCGEPQGAFYAFPDVSGTFAALGVDSSAAFTARLLDEARVAVVPGAAFGMDNNVRLSYATSMDNIEEGLNRLAAFIAAGR